MPAWLLVALGLGLGASALVADTAGNPYLGILNRNLFRLRPPPPIGTDLPPRPLPKVKVVGITTFPDASRALLKVYLPAIPPEPAKEFSCILTIGQRQEPIEVLEIDAAAGSVKVRNSGAVMVLTLDKDSPRPQNLSLPPDPPPLPMQSASRR
jgi:hypothetical protein